ncbi:hypothetical protein LAZ67_2005175 [Cordylochernes scorpioides]|uniref:Uncharacterized protein n=1 Tax=Cordylochernes scorpioides TaxID=51811 RepID=A0ABY6K4B8_9ARAC|nr:hypothetical protein LAZ67_2005175 [Cordylochernes scorpioides]
MATSDMRNRRYVQPLLTWSTDSSCIPGALTGYYQPGQLSPEYGASATAAEFGGESPAGLQRQHVFRDLRRIRRSCPSPLRRWRGPRDQLERF